MIRDDPRAAVISVRAWLFWKRWWFKGTGLGRHPVRLDTQHFKAAALAQETEPTRLVQSQRRVWWWYGDRFYYEDEGLTADDVRALVWQRYERKSRAIQHAHTMLNARAGPHEPHREGIPEDLRRYVFQRDSGRCRQCGSQELIQFDHIIPVALGGATSAENLQVLCIRCNREKSATI